MEFILGDTDKFSMLADSQLAHWQLGHMQPHLSSSVNSFMKAMQHECWAT